MEVRLLNIAVDEFDEAFVVIANTREGKKETSHPSYQAALTEALRTLVREQAISGMRNRR